VSAAHRGFRELERGRPRWKRIGKRRGVEQCERTRLYDITGIGPVPWTA
jgi:hypothetical protein